MAEKELAQRTETLAQKMANILYEMENVPTEGPAADIAQALGKLTAVEKAMRKAKNAWMASLVKQAGQRALV